MPYIVTKSQGSIGQWKDTATIALIPGGERMPDRTKYQNSTFAHLRRNKYATKSSFSDRATLHKLYVTIRKARLNNQQSFGDKSVKQSSPYQAERGY